MAAVLAFHHTSPFGTALGDRYGNDPFVWVRPFLWSHCHARSRSSTFGMACIPPLVHERDAVFFLSHDRDNKLVCDCVFVIAETWPIASAEVRFPPQHPARHYHFDQRRNPHHVSSARTRIADEVRSFVPDPPMPIGRWISGYVSAQSLTVHQYFAMNKIKNVRIVTRDAEGLYKRVVSWSKEPGHRRRKVLSMRHLRRSLPPEFPGSKPIAWP
jgi:hypothetical protein